MYVSDSPLVDKCFLKTFFQSGASLFILLAVSFEELKLILMKCNLLNFCF